MSVTTNNLGHRFQNGPWLFRGLNRSFAPGSLTGVAGPSGTGKSTLLQILSGALNATEGVVLRPHGSLVATIHQYAYGISHRSVLDHIVLPFLARGVRRREAEPMASKIATQFGIEALLDAPFRQLSGGESQRLMLAIALAQEADVIIADEPTASLDGQNAAGITDVLGELSAQGAIVIVATHDDRVLQVCDELVDLTRLTTET